MIGRPISYTQILICLFYITTHLAACPDFLMDPVSVYYIQYIVRSNIEYYYIMLKNSRIYFTDTISRYEGTCMPYLNSHINSVRYHSIPSVQQN